MRVRTALLLQTLTQLEGDLSAPAQAGSVLHWSGTASPRSTEQPDTAMIEMQAIARQVANDLAPTAVLLQLRDFRTISSRREQTARTPA